MPERSHRFRKWPPTLAASLEGETEAREGPFLFKELGVFISFLLLPQNSQDNQLSERKGLFGSGLLQTLKSMCGWLDCFGGCHEMGCQGGNMLPGIWKAVYI